MSAEQRRFIPATAILARLPVSRRTLDRMVRSGRFPRPCPISAGRIAWDAATVEAWFDARAGGERLAA